MQVASKVSLDLGPWESANTKPDYWIDLNSIANLNVKNLIYLTGM